MKKVATSFINTIENDGKLPQGAQMRLETIAALAVRLRETVRRLSQEWENEPRGVEQSEVKFSCALLILRFSC